MIFENEGSITRMSIIGSSKVQNSKSDYPDYGIDYPECSLTNSNY